VPQENLADRPKPAKTVVVGLLGGVASGKSSVGRILAGADGVLIDADALAHEALASPEVATQVAETFGPETLGSDGLPDREALGRLVFQDPERRRMLESWIHPRVRANIRSRLDEALQAQVPVVVIDVPLLLESTAPFAQACGALVFVDAPPGDRDRRAIRNRNWATGEVARRERTQLSLDEKRRRADHVVVNAGTPEELVLAVQALRAELLNADG